MPLPRIKVMFDKKIRNWDGFGVTYVETAQTRDYAAYPQEYGGFRYLTETQREEIIDLIFGDDGLRPGSTKMFLDPFHQESPGSPFDHERTTHWMRYFVQNGLQKTRERGDDLQIITTLYGPPAWATKQKFIRGRDLDPQHKEDVARYMIHWLQYLDKQNYPVRYLSLHNEGEDWHRWPKDGSTAGTEDHDYNMYWSPEQVVDFLQFMPAMLEEAGLEHIGLTPGETSGWYRFHSWGYADAIADSETAAQNLGLITSHGFFGGDMTGDWFNDWRSVGNDILRRQQPDLHAWVTSTSWSNMDVFFINEIRNSIYSVKINGLIPWACVQLQGHWEGGDPNPGTAIRTYEDGNYEVTQGYHYFKQVCRAGQPGMAICTAAVTDRRSGIIAFGGNQTKHPDTFVFLNMWDTPKTFTIEITGTSHTDFQAYQTDAHRQYESTGTYQVENGFLTFEAPALSVTTFYGC